MDTMIRPVCLFGKETGMMEQLPVGIDRLFLYSDVTREPIGEWVKDGYLCRYCQL